MKPLKGKSKRWQQRAFTMLTLAVFFVAAVAIALKVFNDNIIFFLSPSELALRQEEFEDKEIRVGGLVVAGSIKYLSDDKTLEFKITDLDKELTIHYRGITPNLFAEDQGTVAFGRLDEKGVFIAKELLAKHDETYMPKEVADALKKSGRWKPESKLGQEIKKEEEQLEKPPYSVFSEK